MGTGLKRAKKATQKTKKSVTKATKKGTLVTFILDESGSMSSCKTDTIGGYNEYIKKLQAEGKDILFSLTKFDSMHVTRVLDGTKVKDVPLLTDRTFSPGASTPLYDAIGKTIESTNEDKRNVVCIIMTDGEENASIEHTKATVEKLIKEKTKQGWTFVYLGADVAKEVPFKIIVASEAVKTLGHNYVVNPNNVVCVVNSKISDTQKTLGLIVTTPEENRFYFAETVLGNTISSFNSKYTEHSRKYLLDFYQNSIGLRELLEEAGAKIVKNSEKCDIDLSPENIQRDTILSLFKKNLVNDDMDRALTLKRRINQNKSKVLSR